MKWSIIQLQKFRDKTFLVDESIELPSLMERNAEIRAISPVQVKGRADISSEKITFHLQIEATLTLPCARTLVDVPYPVSLNTVETFLLNPSYVNELGDEETHSLDGDVINLLPILEEILLVEIPLQVFSDEALEEKDMASGRDWEVLTEEELDEARSKEQEEQPATDPRLAGLAKFFDENKDT